MTLVEIAYNQATTELQMGLTQEALRHLLEHPWNEALYFHKLAICYERLGQEKLARVAFGPSPGGASGGAALRSASGAGDF